MSKLAFWVRPYLPAKLFLMNLRITMLTSEQKVSSFCKDCVRFPVVLLCFSSCIFPWGIFFHQWWKSFWNWSSLSNTSTFEFLFLTILLMFNFWHYAAYHAKLLPLRIWCERIFLPSILKPMNGFGPSKFLPWWHLLWIILRGTNVLLLPLLCMFSFSKLLLFGLMLSLTLLVNTVKHEFDCEVLKK